MFTVLTDCPLSRLIAVSVASVLGTLCVFVGVCADDVPSPPPLWEQFPVHRAASAMVDDELLIQGGLESPRVIDVMRRVPRHLFVPDGYRSLAYRDMALAIGESQTISPPYIVATMTQSLDVVPTDRVLEIGTGSGYQAAVLALLAKEVYTIEIVESLGNEAAARLAALQFLNVRVRVGDGYAGWPEAAPFDKIIVTCSPDAVPQPLIDQLRDGGKMLIPIGERYQQRFVLLTKRGTMLEEERLAATYFVPMTGEAESRRRDHPNASQPKLVDGEFDATYHDHPLGWHYARNTRVVSDDATAPSGNYLRIVRDDPHRIAQVIQGFPVDGETIASLRLEWLARATEVRPVAAASGLNRPTIYLVFYDAKRHIAGEVPLAPVSGTTAWRRQSRVVSVPKAACDANIIIGLFEATGTLDMDDIRLAVSKKRATRE